MHPVRTARLLLAKHGLTVSRIKVGARQFRYEAVVPSMRGKHTTESIYWATYWRQVNHNLDRISP